MRDALTNQCHVHHKWQEEAKFLASIGTGVPAVLAALDKAMGNAHTPPSVLLTLLVSCTAPAHHVHVPHAVDC